MADDWSRDEVEATVADYFAMLRLELAGVRFNKAARNRALTLRLAGRSGQSVEFKHANISAVMLVYGLPYIDGYKPRGNYQQLLEQVVLEYLATEPGFFDDLLQCPVLNPQVPPPLTAVDVDIEEGPPDPMLRNPRVWDPNARVVKIDFVQRDAENRRLGRLGEEFVMEFERKRLHDRARRPDLSARIEWTAAVRGDGAGYDIKSFEEDGRPRYIEVKTTGLAKSFPFCVTANEVACSVALCTEYHLYRLFRFSNKPGLYVLTGALSQTCMLDPIQFRARFG